MKYTIITGASSGIGKELAIKAAHEGKNIVVVARRKEKLEELQKEIITDHDVDVVIVEADLSTRKGVQAVIKAVETKEVEYLINNAGFGHTGAFKDQDERKITSMIDLNIKALTTLTHGLLEKLEESKGGILNLASTAAFIPGPFMAEYFATKHYVLAFSEALSKELEGKVTVSVLCPGATQSEFQDRANMNGVFKNGTSSLPTAKEVADYGWKLLVNGKQVGVHGFGNKATVLLGKVLPRFVKLNMVASLFKK